MKNVIIGIAVIAIAATACNNSNDASSANKKNDSLQGSTTSTETTSSNNADANVNGAMKEMIGQYLQMKNALANDNGKDAAAAGKTFVESMGKMDKTSLTGEKLKKWNDVSDDAKEMAEHIGENAGKIDHQREHFDMLSADVYDLAKTFGAGQTLYKVFCPMYNDKKGAIWLSETKEIKNPYLGKKMSTCGEVQEEMK